MMGAAVAVSTLAAPAIAQDKKVTVVATTGMIADAVKQIGGDRVEVTALMGPGVDPHVYRQTRSDISAMVNADAVFWHGLYLEAQMEDLFKQLSHTNTVVALAESLPKDQLLPNEDYENRYDPHVWMNPRLWKGVVESGRQGHLRRQCREAPGRDRRAGRLFGQGFRDRSASLARARHRP
jgi:manganese/zinc/iron transport system substrate-binding protein